MANISIGNMLTVTVSVCGTRPALWHAFGPQAIPVSGKRERSGVAGNDPDEWRQTVLMTAERQLFFAPSYAFGCLKEAARYTRRGRSTLQTAVTATLIVLDERLLVDRYVPLEPLPTNPAEPVYLSITGVVNPATRARNVRYRVAASAGWRTQFALSWDRTVVSRQELEAIVLDAGRLVGLGSGRSIGFGRFAVEGFEVSEGVPG